MFIVLSFLFSIISLVTARFNKAGIVLGIIGLVFSVINSLILIFIILVLYPLSNFFGAGLASLFYVFVGVVCVVVCVVVFVGVDVVFLVDVVVLGLNVFKLTSVT